MYSEAIAYRQLRINKSRHFAVGSINNTRNHDVNSAKGLISMGIQEDAVEFIKTFDKKIEQLPKKEAKKVVRKLSKMFRSASPEYMDKLKNSTKYLMTTHKKPELEMFNYMLKRVLVFARQHNADIKRFL